MIKTNFLILIILSLVSFNCSTTSNKIITPKSAFSVEKIEMFLNAFGVESDGFPSIHADIDFKKNTSTCKVSYYNPIYKDSAYLLTTDEIRLISDILHKSELQKLKKEYTVDRTDQPTSTTTIHTDTEQFIIKDYGLVAESPMEELYRIVYKLSITNR